MIKIWKEFKRKNHQEDLVELFSNIADDQEQANCSTFPTDLNGGGAK